MCGIAGAFRFTQAADGRDPAALAAAMNATLVHRGPDDHGLWRSDDGSLALAQRRLSIVNLSPLGRNPMAWDNGRLWITFNGEIYNFLELRAELEAAGCRFKSRTDTEVILAAYDRWGTSAVDRFAGMFALALWDAQRRRLWIVRDRLGKKPLYYSERNGLLVFGSELKAILADPTFPRDIDPDAIGLYLRYGYVPSPHTIFSAAKKLPPAHQLICEGRQISVTRYWDPLDFVGRQTPVDEAEAADELESRLRIAVTQREIADVPLGAFLSGGIDSSLVVALMQEHAKLPVKTFSIRFENPAYNEADHAAAVARYLRTEHHEETCDDRQTLAVVPDIPTMFDEPFADSSAIPTHLVSRIARHSVTVALSGDGGDELFCGYPRYRYHADVAWAMSLPPAIRAAAAAIASRMPQRRMRRIADVLRSNETDQYARFISWWTPDEVQRLIGRPPAPGQEYAAMLARISSLSASEQSGLLDLVSYLPEDILTKVDRASMAISLEVRAPLLDHRVVEFALGLPTNLKRRGSATKFLLRRLLYMRVPRELIDRPKMGFGVPLEDWFRGPLREHANSYLAGSDFEPLGIDPQPVRQLWTDFQNGRTHRTDLLWQMFALAAWSRSVCVQSF